MAAEVGGQERQQVVCVWCRRTGPSPVKKKLVEPGRDYPLFCRDCKGVGVIPVTDPDAARFLEPARTELQVPL